MRGGLSHDELEMALHLAEDDRLLQELEREKVELERDAERAAGDALAETVQAVIDKHLRSCSLGHVKVAVMKLDAALMEFVDG